MRRTGIKSEATLRKYLDNLTLFGLFARHQPKRNKANNYTFERKKMQEIIDDGDKVKVVMKLRGREMGMKSQLVPKIKEFCDILQGVVYESQPQVFGNKVIAVIKKNT